MSEKNKKTADDAYLEWLYPVDLCNEKQRQIAKEQGYYRRRYDYETFIKGTEFQKEELKDVLSLLEKALEYSNLQFPEDEDGYDQWRENVRSVIKNLKE